MIAADTIFALSSGQPPAAISIVRVSGSRACAALTTLAGGLPRARRATVKALRMVDGELLDRAMVLWLPGPGSATGEDVAEFHLHGGRAIVAAVLGALGTIPGLRAAQAGEFTRRAVANGRIDAAQAVALGDLLAAETEQQRRRALRGVEGTFARAVAGWRDALLAISAEIEAELDFSGEDDVALQLRDPRPQLRMIVEQIAQWTSTLPAERLRDGLRVVIAGPPNSGKSSLLNALAGREVAIVTSTAGTTRDRIEVPIALGDLPVVMIDTAGLRDSRDAVEQMGIARAHDAIGWADILIWLGAPEDAPDVERRIIVQAKADLPGRESLCSGADLCVSTRDQRGISALKERVTALASAALPPPNISSLDEASRAWLIDCEELLVRAVSADALECVAQCVQDALSEFQQSQFGLSERVLDRVFARFCIGK